MEEKIKIILFDEEELSQTLIESYIPDLTFSCVAEKYSEFDESIITREKGKKIIIININKTNNQIFEKAEKLSQDRNNIIIFISYDKTADIQVRALRSGAKDFLLKPLIKSDFINTLQRIYQKEFLVKSSKPKSNVYSVISVEEGVGKTFFALNLSKILADISKEKVVLIDFNNSVNDLFQVLNIHCNHSTYYYLNTITEENAETMLSHLVKIKGDNFHILGNGIFSNYAIEADTSKIHSFVEILRKYYKYIIFDNDSSVPEINDKLITESDYIYLITDSNISVAEKIKKHKSELMPENKKTRVILNKYNKNKDESIINEIEQIIGKRIFDKIPKNYLAASSAAEKCITIDEIGPKLDIVKEYEKIAKYMVEKD